MISVNMISLHYWLVNMFNMVTTLSLIKSFTLLFLLQSALLTCLFLMAVTMFESCLCCKLSSQMPIYLLLCELSMLFLSMNSCGITKMALMIQVELGGSSELVFIFLLVLLQFVPVALVELLLMSRLIVCSLV